MSSASDSESVSDSDWLCCPIHLFVLDETADGRECPSETCEYQWEAGA